MTGRAGRIQARGIVLSAGRGTRLGGVCKGRILVEGEALLLRQIRAMQQAGITEVTVVLGHQAEALLEVLQGLSALPNQIPIRTIVVPVDQLSEDVQDSVAFALREMSLSDGLDLFMTLVDLPLLRAEHYQSVFLQAQKSMADVVIPTAHAGTPGHPLFIRAPALLGMPLRSLDFRLRRWLRANLLRVQLMPTDDPAHFTDLDTPEDMAKLRAVHGLKLVIPDESLGYDSAQ